MKNEKKQGRLLAKNKEEDNKSLNRSLKIEEETLKMRLLENLISFNHNFIGNNNLIIS